MARSRADEKRDDLCRGKELTLRNSVAGLSLFPLGYDRKERLQTGTYLTLTQNRVRAFGTHFGRKKNFQTKACVHVFSACSFGLGGCRAQCRIAEVLSLFLKDQIEMASGHKGVTPMWHVETARTEPAVRLAQAGVDFELRLKGLTDQTHLLFFFDSQPSGQSGSGWVLHR